MGSNKERKQRQHQKMIAEGWIRYEKKIRPAWRKYFDALFAKLMKTGE